MGNRRKSLIREICLVNDVEIIKGIFQWPLIYFCSLSSDKSVSKFVQGQKDENLHKLLKEKQEFEQ